VCLAEIGAAAANVVRAFLVTLRVKA